MGESHDARRWLSGERVVTFEPEDMGSIQAAVDALVMEAERTS